MKLPTSLIEFLMQEDEVEDALQSYACDQTDERKKRLLETILSEIDSGKNFLTLPYAKCDTCKKHLKEGEVHGNGMKDLCSRCAFNEEEEEREEEEKRREAAFENSSKIVLIPHFLNHVPFDPLTSFFDEYTPLAKYDRRYGEIHIRIKALMKNVHKLGGSAVLVRFELEEWEDAVVGNPGFDWIIDQLLSAATLDGLSVVTERSETLTLMMANLAEETKLAQSTFIADVKSVVNGTPSALASLNKMVDTRFTKNIPGAK